MSGLWMLTRTGKDHYLSGCGAHLNEIDLFDIAWSLAQLNRFTGHCLRPYSVAEHSLLTADLAERAGYGAMVQLLCLMHDAHEAYTGDVSSPAKNAIGLGWGAFEHAHADRVRRALGLNTGFTVHRRLVVHFDLVALATERRDLMSFEAGRNREWPVVDEPGGTAKPADGINLNSLDRVQATWQWWREAFLSAYYRLQRQVQADAQVDTVPLEPST